MLILQFSYIFSALCLPILLLIYSHPNGFIKWGARILLFGLIFYLLAIVPFVVLTELKYWSLLLVAIPVIFRIISLILDKVGFFGAKNEKNVQNLLYASVSALSVIFVGASSNTLEKLFFLIIILLVLFISDFQIVEKYKYLGALFGPIIAVIPSYENFNVFFTVVAIWLVMTISLDLLLKVCKIKKTKHIEKTTLIVFITISLIVANNGGIELNWIDSFLMILTFVVIVCLLLGGSFLTNRKIRNEYLKQFLPVLISSIFLGFLLILVNKDDGVREFFSSFLLLIVILCVVISLSRLISPLDKLTDSKSFPFNMNNINEMLEVVLGKKLGKAVFNNLFGLNYQAIHIGISMVFFVFYVLVGGYVIQSIFFSGKLVNLLLKDQALLPLVIANSLFAALILISELIRVSSNNFKENGMSSKDALHSSTVISLEYFFIFIPFLFIGVKDFENLNTSFILMGCLFLSLFYVNINLFLYLDLRKPQFNNFKKIRLVLSGLLQGVAIAAAPILFFLEYKNDGLYFVNQYNATAFLLGFIFMYPAKLLGYDSEFGSKRAYKRSWLKLVFLILSLNALGYKLPFVMYLFIQDESRAVYFAVIMLIMLISMLGRELAMVVLPWSNVSEKSITYEWRAMLKKIKVENEEINKKSKKKGAQKKAKSKK